MSSSVLNEKIEFQSRTGATLAGRLDRPVGTPRAWALFAHCFTCSKDIPAAGRIARALAARGIAVLRFDFTGLGSSEGDFANTDFSSNVDDLVAAARHLREHHGPARLLVGHSLGGAAVLVAAGRLEEVEAVATIAAPADTGHLRELLGAGAARIEEQGVGEIDIGGRPFTIRRELFEDLDAHRLGEELGALRRALLVLHSPVDEIVGIDHAERIYRAARGFKSFVSLADADHLLSRRRDAEYAGEVLAAWAGRYLELDAAADVEAREGQVLVEELERPYTNRVVARGHGLWADEPRSVPGAHDAGPTPYELLLAGLGACTSMTLRMYADRKGWPLERVRVHLDHDRIHAADCASCETEEGKVDRITTAVEIVGPELDGEQRARLLEIAERCPVHRTLIGEKEMVTREA